MIHKRGTAQKKRKIADTTDWTAFFHDPVIVTAILDRLIHHSTVIDIRGNSHRFMEKTAHEALVEDQNAGERCSVLNDR